MRPLHVGLLAIGAALAGGLAVKMTQPQAFQITRVKPPAPPPVAAPAPAAPESRTVSAAPASPDPTSTEAPAPIYREEKPKPFVAKPEVKAPEKVLAKASSPPAQVSPPRPRVDNSPVTIPRPAPAVVPYQPTPYQPTPEAAPTPPAETVREPDPPPAPLPLNPAPLQVTLRQGTSIAVRLDQALSSDHLSAGDTFQASLAEPLIADGYVIAERGARVSGRVVDSQRAGRLSGSAGLGLSLSSIQTTDGQKIAVSTEPWTKSGDSSRNEDIAKIGGGAALGAIIGAIAGGGKGAAIGAGVGGAAGTGAAATTRGKPVTIASETVIRFRLATRVKITERPL
jgi:hypothetical protein